MNDQPNGRSKHDPRQSSHNRDHLEKKIILDWEVETAVATTVAGRDWPPRGGVGVPSCPALPFRFPGISAILTKWPAVRGGKQGPPCPSCAEYGKRGLL